jgi:hypothetical protein
MIVAAAQVQNCTALLSEDLHDGLVCGTVTVVSPFALRIEDDHPSYMAPAKPRSRHRGRGRPRRSA